MNEMICDGCRYFRKALHPSERLIKIVNTSDGTVDATIADAISRIEDDERRVEDEEINTKERREGEGRIDWGHRPLMSDYCGLREHERTFLIAELVRTSDLECEYYKPNHPVQREQSCVSCVHRSKPAGPAQDAKNLETIKSGLDASLGAGLFGGTPGPAGTWMGENRQYFQGIRQRQATEISRASKELGTVRIEPQYIPYCKKYSGKGKYVLCLWQNPYNACQDWQVAVNQTSVSGSGVTRFEAQTNALYNHPQGGYSLVYRQEHPGTSRYLELSIPFDPRMIVFSLEKLPNRRWVKLRHPQGLILPLAVYREDTRVFAEWLTGHSRTTK